jgi:antitoxin component of MazEF toxin-antitoxin module
MSREQITRVGTSAALLLPQDVLDQMGVSIGDEVDLSIVNRKVILRPLDEVEREQKLEAATQDIFERRRSAYERLAGGAD